MLPTSTVHTADYDAECVNADTTDQLSVPGYNSLPPLITTLVDIITQREKIIDWCELNPLRDHVYEFKNTTIRNGSGVNMIDMFDEPNSFIAGSYALQQLLRYLEVVSAWSDNISTDDVIVDGDRVLFSTSTSYVPDFSCKWSSNDVDLFLINKERPARSKIGSGLDIISSPEKSVTELLIGFDLPVCRVAIDFKHTYYVSIQAMYSIITRKIILPSYMKNKQLALKIMTKCCASYIPLEDRKTQLPLFLIDRFYERLKKYSGRGFGIRWVDTNEIIQWMKTRSLYALTSGNK